MKAEVAQRAEEYCLTYITDGWESVDVRPLINTALVVPTCGAFFFASHDTSGETKSSEFIAKTIIDDIYNIGPSLVLHVCSDTCAAMKGAWKLVEAEFPWIFCTGCAPHVGSLFLKVCLAGRKKRENNKNSGHFSAAKVC